MANRLVSYLASGVFQSAMVARIISERITPAALATPVQELRAIKLSAAQHPTNGYHAHADIRAMKLPHSIRPPAYGTCRGLIK